MQEKKPLTAQNKVLIGLYFLIGIASLVIASFANATPNGPPLVILTIWLNGVLWYAGISIAAQLRPVPQILEFIKHLAVMSTIVIIFFL